MGSPTRRTRAHPRRLRVRRAGGQPHRALGGPFVDVLFGPRRKPTDRASSVSCWAAIKIVARPGCYRSSARWPRV